MVVDPALERMLKWAGEQHRDHCKHEEDRIADLRAKKLLDMVEDYPRLKNELDIAERRIKELGRLAKRAARLLLEDDEDDDY